MPVLPAVRAHRAAPSRLPFVAAVVVCAIGAVGSTACSETMYAYVPTSNASAAVAGQPAADYPLPPAAPQGDVKIASYGITDVHPKESPDTSLGAVHLRAVITNSSDRVWSFDTREQMLDLSGYGSGAPAFASTDPAGSSPPLVTVNPGSQREVDLFYILPRDLQESGAVPAFACSWKVNTGDAIIAEHTPFQRVEVDGDNLPAYAYETPASYWDGPYWINPYYPYGGFYGAVLLPGAYWGHGLYVHRGPYVGGWHGGGNRGGGGFRGSSHGGGGGGRGGGGHGGGHR